MSNMYNILIQFIRDRYPTKDQIPLHAPLFIGHERQYLLETINSTFVSSVGPFVDQFEQDMAAYTKSPKAVVTVNGTSALHMALILAGVTDDDYVLTQALTFVATGNAIRYCHAEPIFIDVDKTHLGLSPLAMDAWLEEHAYLDGTGHCRHKNDHRIIRACVPMHTFGHPVDPFRLILLIMCCNPQASWGELRQTESNLLKRNQREKRLQDAGGMSDVKILAC